MDVETPGGPADDSLQNPVAIYSAKTVQQAHFLKNLLADVGIEAIVSNEVLHGGSGIDLVGLPTAAKVLVAEKDAHAARRFALEFDDNLIAAASTPTAPGENVETSAEPSDTWPQCPQCDARRTTQCPVCKTAGTDFPPADADFLGTLGPADDAAPVSCGCGPGGCSTAKSQAQADSSQDESPKQEDAAAVPPELQPSKPPLTLMCPTCDEPFVPEFPCRCEWCGHEFADGYDVDKMPLPEQLPVRMIAVIFALLALLLVTVIYFMWIV